MTAGLVARGRRQKRVHQIKDLFLKIITQVSYFEMKYNNTFHITIVIYNPCSVDKSSKLSK